MDAELSALFERIDRRASDAEREAWRTHLRGIVARLVAEGRAELLGAVQRYQRLVRAGIGPLVESTPEDHTAFRASADQIAAAYRDMIEAADRAARPAAGG